MIDDVHASENSLTPITVQLRWKHQFQFAGYYMALEKGYYQKAGFDVTLKAAIPGETAIPGQLPYEAVAEGKADFGVGTTDLLLVRAKGIPVVLLANVFQHSPQGLMIKATGEPINIHKLASLRIMVDHFSAEMLTYFASEGMDPEKLKLEEHSFNINDFMDPEKLESEKHSFSINDLIEGKIDALSVYITDAPYVMEQHDIEYHLFGPQSSGIDFYGDNLFALETMIENNPEQVAAFLEASKKGWAYAFDNIDETVEVIKTIYNSDKTHEHLLFEADAMRTLVMPSVVEIGYINPFRWERIAQAYKNLSYLPESFILEGFIYDPNKPFIPQWVWKAIAIAVSISFFAILIALYVSRMNMRLRKSEIKLNTSNSQKEILLSIIGHDMKNYIFSVRRYAELLLDQDDSLMRKDVVKHSRQILCGIDEALNLMDNLLQWSTLDRNGNAVDAERVNIGPIVEKNMALFKPHADGKKIQLSAGGYEGVSVLAHNWPVDTVLRNLLNNALKFTPKEGAVAIKVISVEGAVDIIVEDTGVGIPEEKLDDILENFVFEDKNATVSTGFGLPLCKKIMEPYHGRISIKNRVTGGLQASFRFRS